MALARLLSRGQRGMDAYEVAVETHLAGGLPAFRISGLPAAAVRESKDRVRAALQSCGFDTPPRRITVHLGPADIPKEGGRFDLPIALGVAQAAQAFSWQTEHLEFLGELALDGELRPIRGTLPAVLAARDARRAIVVPAANAAEAALVGDATCYAAGRLLDVIEHLNGSGQLERVTPGCVARPRFDGLDLADVAGQTLPKRALEIAAAGAHNLLFAGPPGTGKSMLAQRLPGLLPALSAEELLQVSSIASIAGEPADVATAARRPYRAPHHSASVAALVGGGAYPRPGEISLAHLGVLFLDELPEFSRAALESLREPLQSGVISIARAAGRVSYPARFQLIAAMNPCPCGYLGDGSDRCRCTQARLGDYRARLSGPLLDRFDMHVEVARVPFEESRRLEAPGATAAAAGRITAARSIQLERGARLNAHLEHRALLQLAGLDRAGERLLAQAAERWRLSTRCCDRVLKVARTIADLGESGPVQASHVAEAIQLRCLDRPL
jgi:magnesium chelatase family protein